MCSGIKKVWSKEFKSVDAYVMGNDGRYYFIEFKNQPSKNIEKDDVWEKAIESLFCASLSVLHSISMAEIRKKSVFILVYKKDPDMTTPGKGKVKSPVFYFSKRQPNAEKQILGLEKTFKVKFKLYSEVHTFLEGQFNDYCLNIFA